jgi:two-component system, NtrC family, response regulator HydG
MRLDLDPDNPDLAALLDRLELAVFTIDSGGHFAGWSRGATKITGLAAERVVGQPVALLDTDAPRGLSALSQRLRDDDCPDFVNGLVTLRHAEGHELTLIGDLRVLELGAGAVGIVGALTHYGPHLSANRRLAEIVPPGGTRRVFHQMVGESPQMRGVFEELEQAAAVDVTVLVRGETGTGKELVARAIHALGKRKDAPLVCVNCSAIPDPLLESELFGHVRGAFTGATRDKRGVFEEADGGVLFLDEVGDLGPAVQVKLLRALQEREIRRVGDSKTRKVDVRIVSATNRDLASMVANGSFREDLYYRIRVFELQLPPLRGREGDVETLAEHLVEQFSAQHDKRVSGFTDEALASLRAYSWPGNVRELRNAIEHAFVTVRGESITLQNLPAEVRRTGVARSVHQAAKKLTAPADLDPKRAEERARIVAALREAGGKKTQAAALLGISRVTLWKKLKRLGINPVYVDPGQG